MFNRAVHTLEWLAKNPAVAVRQFHGEKRKFYLNTEQAQALIQVLDRYNDQKTANAIKLLLYTGARRGEVLGATWEQFKLQAEPPVWVKPASSTKQAREHRIPLNAWAVEVLRKMRAQADPAARYLFPSDG
jgi:integrase